MDGAANLLNTTSHHFKKTSLSNNTINSTS